MQAKAINDDKFWILMIKERQIEKAYLLWPRILKSELLAQVLSASSSAHCWVDLITCCTNAYFLTTL